MRQTRLLFLGVLVMCTALTSCGTTTDGVTPTSASTTTITTTTITTEATTEPPTSVGAPGDLLNVSSDDWVYQSTNTETWRYGPRVVKPGVADFLALTADEICPLMDVPALLDRLGVKATLDAPVWRQTDFQTECSVTVKLATSDEYQTITWESARYDKSVWPPVEVEGSRTTEDVKVDGRDGRLSITTDGVLKGVSILVAAGGDRAISLDVPDLGLLVKRDVMLDLAKELVQKFAALKPKPQPAIDAPVQTPLDLSAAQLCSLMQDTSLETWVGDKDLPFIDGYELSPNGLNCSRGGTSFAVSISSTAPYVDESVKPDESSYLASAELDGRTGYRRRYLRDDKTTVESVDLLMPWSADYWVEVEVRFPKEGPAFDKLITDEMRHVLAELDKRVIT
jgi:hypothetical protein